MKINILYIILFFNFFCSGFAYAQQDVEEDHDLNSLPKDTVKSQSEALLKGKVYYFYDKFYQPGIPAMHYIDTLDESMQWWDLSMRDRKYRALRGNQGLTDQLLEYEISDQLGFDYGIDLFKTYRMTYDNTVFYQVGDPFTSLYYANSPQGKINLLDVTHTQNVWRSLNLGIQYRLLSDEGTYQRMANRQDNLRLFGNYITRNQKYRVLAGYYRNKINSQENGGITTDSLFTQNDPQYENRQVMPVNLSEAGNKWVENSFYLKQSFHLHGGHYDSIQSTFYSLGYFSLTTDVKRIRKVYTDNQINPDYYPHIYWDSIRTYDSTFVFSIKNLFSWSLGDLDNFHQHRPFKILLGLQHHYQSINDTLSKKEVYEFMPVVKAQFNFWKNLYLLGSYEQIANGENVGDMHVYGNVSWLFHPKENTDGVSLKIGQKNASPAWYMLQMNTNHYRWTFPSDDFGKQGQFYAGLSVNWKGVLFNTQFTRISNFQYMTAEGPAKADRDFSVLKMIFDKNFKIGKYFRIDNHLVFQQISDDAYLHLPVFSARQSYYATFKPTRKSLLNIGLDLLYNTAYYADDYAPALGCYVWQNQVQTGNYVYLSPFATLNIKRATIFLKYQHMNAGWMGYDYIMTPHYPMPEAAFQYGIRWLFYD